MDISYELYKVFYYVATSRSFSEAGSKLFISQSAVSQSVRTLERRLGQTLFVRKTKRVTLTKEGEMLFKHIEPAVHLILRGEQQVLNSGRLSSQLRIGASDTICRYVLVPYFKRLHELLPEVHINIVNGTSPQCAQMLSAGDVDLIVTNSPNPLLGGNRTTVTVKTFHDIFVGNPKAFSDCFRRQDGRPVPLSLAELLHYPLMMLSKHSATSAFLHEHFQKHSLDLAPEIELNSNDLLLDLARIGLGIACVPDYCLHGSGNTDDLCELTISDPLPERALLLAYDDSRPLTPAAEMLRNMLTGNPVSDFEPVPDSPALNRK
ncbi:MAG: LysR family transcriptional regulator [Lachnospiraceae bacterium]|nr:LysR family transcriptional regulator [Lachnospiraceae bacterium]